MAEKKKFNGKVALVTGSSRGIGLATARALGARGASVALNGRSAGRLNSVAKELTSEGFDAAAFQADISSPEQCREMIEKIVDKFGRLDILVNNAGLSMRADFDTLDAAQCGELINVNLLGAIYPTLHAMPELKKNRGSVVFISSIAGLIGLPTATLYCAAKSALRGFADSLRCEVTPHGVHVGVAYVGFTENAPDKTVVGAAGEALSPNRPALMSQKEVADEIAAMLSARKRETVMTPIGRFAALVGRLSPEAVESAIILSRKYKLNERFGIR